MAEMAQRILMNEFKQLSKEKWTNIEVSGVVVPSRFTVSVAIRKRPANHVTAHQRKRLRVERSPHCLERGIHVLWRLLQGKDDLSTQLPTQPTRYVTVNTWFQGRKESPSLRQELTTF